MTFCAKYSSAYCFRFAGSLNGILNPKFNDVCCAANSSVNTNTMAPQIHYLSLVFVLYAHHWSLGGAKVEHSQTVLRIICGNILRTFQICICKRLLVQNVFRTFWNISAVYYRHVLSTFHANIPEVQQKLEFPKDCLCKMFSERFGIFQPYIPGMFSAYSIKNLPKRDRLKRFSFPAETLWNVSGTFREQCARSVPKCSACQLSCPIRFERSKSQQSTCRVGFKNVPGTFQNCFRHVLKMILLGYNSRTKIFRNLTKLFTGY